MATNHISLAVLSSCLPLPRLRRHFATVNLWHFATVNLWPALKKPRVSSVSDLGLFMFHVDAWWALSVSITRCDCFGILLGLLGPRTGFNAPATCALWCRWHVHLTYTHTHLSLRPFVKTRGHLELKRDQESTTRFNAQHRCNMTAWQLCLFVSTQKLLQTPERLFF